jgi:hypothetical protein
MPSADTYSAGSLTKCILEGDAGTGKTTSLISLVKQDYQLRIWNFDNLLAPLINRIRAEAPSKLKNVQFMTFRDKLKASPVGAIVDGTPNAFNNSIKALDRWEDGSVPSDWGVGYVAVFDSLSRWADCAMRWGDFITPAGKGGQKDGRAIYGEAQRAITQALSLLTAESFQTNAVLIAHISYQERSGDGTLKGFPKGPGQALSPDIPTYFDTVLLAETAPDGRRTMRTAPTPIIDLKNPLAVALPAVYPLDQGLGEIFKLRRQLNGGGASSTHT